jgi:cyclic beta-1,2-glucan synthetase
MPGDEELVGALAAGIERLNARYDGPPGGGMRFLLLHRRRVWNEREGKWIGWERKRGKLHELNRLLRGAVDTTFMSTHGRPPEVPQGVRYVITLDADTRLPKGTAYSLVGAMAHPLNRPRFDPLEGRVVEGYAVMQPRVTPSLPTGPGTTTYQRIVSGPGGVDPYAAAVSDAYQDLFEEGSYAGKGIYDVDAFEAALAGKVPENTLLSHDLFEGLFARAALLTDVDLFEEFPSNYEIAARRHHRWVRGDWQLLPWILGHARDSAGQRQRTRIPAQGRWKMIDNLRRSLSAPSSLLLAVAAWTLPGVSPVVWTGLLVGSVAVPAFIPVVDGLIPRRWGISKRSHLRAVGSDVLVALSQAFVAITMLAHQAWLMTDAVVRTLSRLYVTRRNLLEWVSAALVGLKPDAWPAAAPLVLLWALSPAIAWRISAPPKITEAQVLSEDETQSLRLISRRTWRFFETFVDAEENALPPDNFQEAPEPARAHRTSPTNLGLYLLSTTVAHDFGWIGILDTVDRLEDTLATMGKLRRFRGHFFNWYDTRDLRPLDPVYVSTVDSGNLAGHLIALAQACRELMDRPLFGPEVLEGIRDALQLVLHSVEGADHPQRTQTVSAVQLREATDGIGTLLEKAPTSTSEWARRLEELETHAENLVDIAHTLASDSQAESRSEVLAWAKSLRDCVRSHARDLETGLLLEDLEPGQKAETSLHHRLSALALGAEGMVHTMDFRFLFDSSRKLFSIGYRVADGTLDPSCYDLLASEARLGSFVSWSGSMFEYLMPLLVMRQPGRSLLDLTCRLVVARQIQYGGERTVPWGVSESGHNLRDVELTYQYSNFGVPGLGLKRGLFEDVVVAPYATALAAMLDPRAALDNFTRLEGAGGRGAYGFYEALDYTPSKLPEKAQVAVVRSYMAHHQGMTLVSLSNVVHDGLTRKRFHAHPMVQAAELLLQERTPRSVAVTRPRGEEVRVAPLVRDLVLPTLRRFESPHDVTPRTHLLSNGRYTVMITAAGSGFSRWNGLSVTRWREDTTRDCWGSFVFLRDTETGEVWSAGFQPSGTEVDQYEVVYSEDRARIAQMDASLSITLEVVVSPEDDAELRRLSVTNLEDRDREIDVTSYAEIVLAPQEADEAHPAFSNLFVETEYVPELGTLLASRRPRSADDRQIWLAHLAAVEGDTAERLHTRATARAFWAGAAGSARHYAWSMGVPSRTRPEQSWTPL